VHLGYNIIHGNIIWLLNLREVLPAWQKLSLHLIIFEELQIFLIAMQYGTIKHSDLERIAWLQPDGWPDITDEFRHYIDYDFCYPVKVTMSNKIVGVGCSIIFGNTAWVAHIIVSSGHRNRGLGFQIVDRLLRDLREKSIDTVLLIATDLGEPVYKKAGFREVSEYIYFKREHPWKEIPFSNKIISCHEDYFLKVIMLDKAISGENRESLIKKFLDINGLVYMEEGEVVGFYLPTLGEGLIFADNSMVGLELMKLKYSNSDHAVIPFENSVGIDFLKQNGFVHTSKTGKRMILGKDISWKPECFFNRISGNYG